MVADALPASKKPQESSLVRDRKIGVPLPQIPPAPFDETPTEYRFRLQKWARSCWGNHDHRLAGCCIRPLPHAGTVDIVRNPDTGSAYFSGLEQCSRVWTCPVCAQRISNERRKELSFALAAAQKKGWTAVLVTFTVRHQRDDLLVALLDALQGAVRDFKSGRAYQDIKHEYGIQGGIKALEMTYGENGWHPHIHELMFLDIDPAKLNLAGFKRWLYDRWSAMLEKRGYNASYEHGLDVRTADSDIADYIAKWGQQPKEYSWGAEHEIARGPNKKAHRDGLTPFQLLEAVSGGDAKARVLFQEYASVMEGKRQLVWSAGLRGMLEIPDELPDEQLPLIDEGSANYILMEIDLGEWKRCCIYEIQPLLLQLAAAGAVAALRAVLDARDIRAHIHEPPEPPPPRIEIAQSNELPGGPEIHVQTTLDGFSTGTRYE